MRRLKINKTQLEHALHPNHKAKNKIKSRFGSKCDGQVIDAHGQPQGEFDEYNMPCGAQWASQLVRQMLRQGETGTIRILWPDHSESKITVRETKPTHMR